MELILRYKEFFELCRYDVNSLFHFSPPVGASIQRGENIEYERNWAQEALDFAFRVLKTELMGFDSLEDFPTDQDVNRVFEQMANNAPSAAEGGAIWSTHQLYLMAKGCDFIDAWLASGDDALFGQKLIGIFNAHNVGFDKHSFYPVKY